LPKTDESGLVQDFWQGGVTFMTTVAIFGASGYVGSALVERMLAPGTYKIRPIIHTSGNAWRLARRGMRLWSADLGSREQVREALRGCDVVVNCAWPPQELMISGLRNLMEVCISEDVKRFVHLSSVAVYGEPPPADSTCEEAEPRAKKGTYGWYKLQQDRLVEKFHHKGLPSVVLCPPNISGPNSPYLLQVLETFRKGGLALVDGGKWPCNLVDVVNLASAVENALTCDHPDGKRIFVIDDEPITWRDLVDGLMPLADGAAVPSSISTEEAQEVVRRQREREALSLLGVVRQILGLPQTRDIARGSPFLVRSYGRIRRITQWLPRGMAGRLTALMEGRSRIAKVYSGPVWSPKLCAHQLRKVRHSSDRARKQLGYTSPIRFSQSMAIFRQWYEVYHGYGSADWLLLRNLYPHAVQVG